MPNMRQFLQYRCSCSICFCAKEKGREAMPRRARTHHRFRSLSPPFAPAAFASIPAAMAGEEMPFEQLCLCCDALAKTTDRSAKPKMLRQLWTVYGKGTHDLFPLMRLLLPQLDTLRPVYRVKQKQLAKMYVDMLCLDPTKPDAQAVLNWKRPSSGGARSADQGNFPEVVYNAIKARCKQRSQIKEPITIRRLNELLDHFARADGMSEKTKILSTMFSLMTAQEQRWLLRIVIKDMVIGLNETSILNLLHPDAYELYNSVCDLQAMCTACADPSFRLESISLQLFKPVKPRLAARGHWLDIPKHVGRKGKMVVEFKLDGERLLLHWQRGKNGEPNKSQWWTRNCNDFTAWYGQVMEPVLQECLPHDLETIVLDGEMMVWNRSTGDYSPFGENRSLADFRKRFGDEHQPCYVVFDLLYLNGEVVSALPLRERREKLAHSVRWKKHSMELSEQTVVAGDTQQELREELMRWLDRAMAKGYEGVMFKALESPYVPGCRDWDWAKLKPDYVKAMGDTLDLLIIASYYGEGVRRGGAISHFLLGVRAPDYEKKQHSSEHPLFYPFCKVGTGYSTPRLIQLREELKPAQHPWHKTARPPHLCNWVPSKTDDEPDFWYEPAKSLLMEVHAYEITASTAIRPCGYTLRFPRCAKIRDDKDWTECETYEEILRRVNDNQARISSAKRLAEDVAKDAASYEEGPKKPRSSARPAVKISAQFQMADLSQVVKESDVLRGVVAVLRYTGTDQSVMPELQALVTRLGGKVHANPTSATTHIISADERPGAQVAAWVKRAVREGVSYDIVHASWLRACEAAGKRVPLEPQHVLYASEDSQAATRELMDAWGDRYAEEATRESILMSMEMVKRGVEAAAPAGGGIDSGKRKRGEEAVGESSGACQAILTLSESAEDREERIAQQVRQLEDNDVAALETRYSMFRGIVAYAPRPSAQIRLRLGGAKILSSPHASVTHVVLPKSAAADGRLAEARAAFLQAQINWSGKHLEEKQFQLLERGSMS